MYIIQCTWHHTIPSVTYPVSTSRCVQGMQTNFARASGSTLADVLPAVCCGCRYEQLRCSSLDCCIWPASRVLTAPLVTKPLCSCESTEHKVLYRHCSRQHLCKRRQHFCKGKPRRLSRPSQNAKRKPHTNCQWAGQRQRRQTSTTHSSEAAAQADRESKCNTSNRGNGGPANAQSCHPFQYV